MARNYESEYKWEKEKYEIIKVKLDKKLGIELKEKLKSEKKSITSWVEENAKKYLKK